MGRTRQCRPGNAKASSLRNVREHPRGIVRLVDAEFGLTRQAALYYVNKLIDAGLLEASGNTKAREYKVSPLPERLADRPVGGRFSDRDRSIPQ